MRHGTVSIGTTFLITSLLGACSAPAEQEAAATSLDEEARDPGPAAPATATAHVVPAPPSGSAGETCEQIGARCDPAPGGSGTALCRALCGDPGAMCIAYRCVFP